MPDKTAVLGVYFEPRPMADTANGERQGVATVANKVAATIMAGFDQPTAHFQDWQWCADGDVGCAAPIRARQFGADRLRI
jgi:hypothetical protein